MRWGSSSDQIVGLASRYDTRPYTVGIDGNGSGIAALLEVARMLVNMPKDCYRVNTIILVALDMETHGAHGSKAFVEEYLVSYVLHSHGIQAENYGGTILTDHIMNYDTRPYSQWLPREFQQLYSSLYMKLQEEGMMGNFLTSLGRM